MKIESKNTGNFFGYFDRIGSGALAVASLVGAFAANTSSAQTASHADTVYDGYLAAFLVTDQRTDSDGNTLHYTLPYLRGSTTNNKQFSMWEEGYCIGALEDAYDASIANNRKDLIQQLVSAYIANYGPSLSSGWNDDIEWGTRTLAHGYQITGDTAFLDAAILNWNKVWDQSWDSAHGGGITEKNGGASRCTLSNAPFIIAGCMLYSSTGDSVYLNRSQQAYDWMRANCFNVTTGQVYEGVGTSNDHSDNTYNHGIFIQAANAIYQLTGNQQYYDDAVKAIEHQKSEHTIFTSSNGAEEFFRGVSLFARMNNLWSTYRPWLVANAQAAWDHRRAEDNLTWQDFNTATPAGHLQSMDANGSLVVQQVTTIRPVGVSELKNAGSALSLNVSGNSTANGAAIVQWTYGGADNSLWTFTEHDDSGYSEIVGVSSGKDVAVQSASTANGAAIIQYAFGSSGNDLWVPALTIRGNYSFVNKKSGKLLEDPGVSLTQGTQMDQWSYNRGREQRWQMVRH